MASHLDLLNPLFQQLTPLLKKAGFKREPDEADIAIFSRKTHGDFQRLGLAIEKGWSQKGDFQFSVLVGIEWGAFPPVRFWQGLPRTHKVLPLEKLVPETQGKLVGSDSTEWKALASQLAQWIAAAVEELDVRREKLRASHVSEVEQAGSNGKKSLAIFAERKQKELKRRTPKGKEKSSASITDAINAFDVAVKLLRARTDQIEELDIYQFQDEGEAHDEAVWRQRQNEFIQKARAVQAEIESAPLYPAETGDAEHDAIPVNGVLFYALWRVGWKHLYVVASHEDTELPIVLMMGTTNIPH